MKPYHINVNYRDMLLIALGAAVGANARYLVGLWAGAQFGTAFPYGTLLINVLGSLLIGVVLGLAARYPAVSIPWQRLLVTGLLGGFTTFSTFSYETYTLLEKGNMVAAALYLLGSVGLGLLGAVAGVGLARLAG